MSQTRIQVRPLAGSLGAEIRGADPAGKIDDATLAEVAAAFLEHCVVVFREVSLSPADLVRFGERFGELYVHPLVPHLDGFPAVVPIENSGKATTLNEHWHSDVTFSERPPKITMLHALEIPAVGGDTAFANQYMAWEALSDGMRRLLEPLRGVHTGAGLAAIMGKKPEDAPRAIHPIGRTHPETGRVALYVTRAFTRSIDGMTAAESRPLLDYLTTHAARPDFTFRHRWAAGDLVMWDNRCVQHYAIHDHGDAKRVLQRITLIGEQPV